MRKHKNWIETFQEYAEPVPTPDLFKKWAGIATISGALERKVWLNAVGDYQTFPNIYCICVSPPAVGKTLMTRTVQRFWGELKDHHKAASSLTRASLSDELNAAIRNIVRPKSNPSTLKFNTLLIAVNELGVLLPSYDGEFMATLTDLYDGIVYSERRRGKDLAIHVENPQLVIFSATPTKFIKTNIPEDAWDLGFLSRTFLVFSGERPRVPLFSSTARNEQLYKELTADLKIIADLCGKCEFTQEAASFMIKWDLEDGPPTPTHPRLLSGYNGRRTQHLLKLCMISSTAKKDSLLIELEDVQEALDWLVEMEAEIPNIFKTMGTGGNMQVIHDTWHFVYERYSKTKKPISSSILHAFLMERVLAFQVNSIIDAMVKSGMLKKVVHGVGDWYEPNVQRPHMD